MHPSSNTLSATDSRRRKLTPPPLQSSKSVPSNLRVDSSHLGGFGGDSGSASSDDTDQSLSKSTSSSRKYATLKPSSQQLYGLDAELRAKVERESSASDLI